MTYKELKEFLNTLSEDQLNQKAVFFLEDEEFGSEISEGNISDEDIFWNQDGDCLGPLGIAKREIEELGDVWEIELPDLTIVPKGTVTLHSNF